MVSKLFRAYELYNSDRFKKVPIPLVFQSSFELTSYITDGVPKDSATIDVVSKLFRAYELYNNIHTTKSKYTLRVSKLFRAYELYN